MRHSTRQMTKMYGVDFLLSVLAGDKSSIKQITESFISLKFSRSHETEADERSVLYLCPTQYNAAGGAGFFEKIVSKGGARQPEFLSTHPDPGNRIEHFNTAKKTMGCSGNMDFKSAYQAMVKLLPK
jgi:predicted Zn-dependent protease